MILSFIWSALFSFPVFAGIPICALIFSQGILGGGQGYGKEIDYRLYQPYQRQLFLSDGIADKFGFPSTPLYEPGAFTLAERIAARFPVKEITQGDFNIKGDTSVGNLRQMFIDNSVALPFSGNVFDLIVLRKGLCRCACYRPCAGFSDKYASSKAFFQEIIRVLDTSNPDALAILHGQEYTSNKVVARWKRIAEELQAEFPVEFIFVHSRPEWGFEPDNHKIDAFPKWIGPEFQNLQGDLIGIYIRPSNNNGNPLPNF